MCRRSCSQLKVRWRQFHPHSSYQSVKEGSLGRRLLMTSIQEPNTMAPQSALCICSRKWKTKLIVPIYFGTKTPEFCLRIISFSSLESELSFDSKDSKINFDRARSTTVKSLLGALRALYNISRPLCGRAACILGMER